MKSKMESAKSLAHKYKGRDLNEADTRHQIINTIIHDILSWPKESICCESYIDPGFADYVLVNNNKTHLIIEAKKQGVYFNLPNSFNLKTNFGYIKLNQLLTDASINKAILQVKNYCISEGITYACISNGNEWIFFKTFEHNKKWKTLNAFVIKNLHYFSNNYSHAVNNFSFSNIFENRSLKALLSVSHKNIEIYSPKSKILSYNRPVESNTYASILTPVIDKYFGDISVSDKDFMENCYVAERHDSSVKHDLYNLLQDSLTPYFLQYRIRQIKDAEEDGGTLGKILLESSKTRIEKTITIYGGKGAGKSTFLRRLLLFNPPKHLEHFARIAIVDLLDIPDDKSSIHKYIWSELVSQLDVDNILRSDRGFLLKIFNEEYELAKKQNLFGIDNKSERFNELLNGLVNEWKNDYKLCAKAICKYHNKNLKGIIISIDNTDQYSPETQDFCFTVAKQLTRELKCITIISMREERFFSSNIKGTLDAFKVTGFHISSPNSKNVFTKRIEYLQKLLRIDKLKPILAFDVEDAKLDEINIFLDILLNEFKKSTSALNRFLTSCTHGNIRLALLLFRQFVLSGYTNIYEMVSKKYSLIRIHQVLKPVMIPSRYYYDEELSYIPNIFQIRSKSNGSHFTGLRILKLLKDKFEKGSDFYTEIYELLAYFEDTFSMLDDLKHNLDFMLKRGLIESRNRLDEYSEEVDAIKITAFGDYFLSELSLHFTYLDLVCVDCNIMNEQLANSIILASNQEIKLFLKHDRLGRLNTRIEKVDKFIKYLEKIEANEREDYGLKLSQSKFSAIIAEAFERDKQAILSSAKKNC